jgi:hypothetical protein
LDSTLTHHKVLPPFVSSSGFSAHAPVVYNVVSDSHPRPVSRTYTTAGYTVGTAPKSGSQRLFAKKPWPPNRSRRKMILGDDLGLEEATNLALNALVGRFSYRRRCITPLFSWVKTHWFPILGYVPEVFYLPRGWFGFNFHSSEDAAKILEGLWPYDGGSIMLK